MSDSIANISKIVVKRQSWGPLLIIVGAYSLFMLLLKSSTPTSIHYIGTGVSVILVIAGIWMMFYQLKSEDKTLSITTDSDGKAAAPEHAVIQLSKNYEVLRRQTTQGFILAGTFMALGLLVILSGSLGELFGLTKEGSNLTTIAGMIMEFISGTSLFIYRINFKRLNETSDKLESTWRILTAYRLTDDLPEEKKTEATMKLIDALLSRDEPKISQQQH